VFAVLTRPALRYWVYFDEEDAQQVTRHYRALVATSGNEGVLAFRSDQAVELHRLYGEPPDLVLLRQLTPAPPARLESFNVRLGEARGEQRQLLRQLAGQRVRGQGELYVGLRDPYGQFRANTDTPVRFVDYAFGRVLVAGSAGYLSVLPATGELLAQRLAEARRLLAEA
jgi:ESAT-6 protein secretion system EspG family protein